MLYFDQITIYMYVWAIGRPKALGGIGQGFAGSLAVPDISPFPALLGSGPDRQEIHAVDNAYIEWGVVGMINCQRTGHIGY